MQLHHLASTVLNFLHKLEELRPRLFWPVWSVLTTGSALVAMWLFRPTALGVIPKHDRAPQVRFDRSRAAVLSLALLAVFLGCYIAWTMVWEDFAWYDHSQFTLFSLRGIDFPSPIWPESGRFFPLSNQEFNLLAHFNKTNMGYHVFGLVQVLLIAGALLFLDDRMSIAGRVAVIIFLLMTPTVAITLTDLVYPERNVVFFLVCLAFAVKKFEETHSRRWAVAAVVSAQIALYFKEPVSLMLLGFVAARFVFRHLFSDLSSSPSSWLRDAASKLDACLAAQALAFLAFYVFMMFPYTSADYLVTTRRPSILVAAIYYFKRDILVWVFSAVTAARMFLILRRRVTPSLLWDGLACGGLVYFVAYLTLRMATYYYLAPVDLIAVVYLAHVFYSSWPKMGPGIRFAAFVVAMIIAGQNLQQTGFQLMFRKYVLYKKEALARMIVDRYRRDPGSVRSLFFPFAPAYTLAEFGAYLSYRGLPLEVDGSGVSSASPTVEIFSPKIPKTGRCIYFMAFVCHAGQPGASSLTIALPDDPMLPSESKLLEESEANLRAFDPRPQPPRLFMRALEILRYWEWY